jgi:cell division cycle 2-like protein
MSRRGTKNILTTPPKHNFEELNTTANATTMSSTTKSRWADDEEDAALEAQRKREKEEKKRLKAEKQRKADEAAAIALQQQERTAAQAAETQDAAHQAELSSRPSKRRRLSPGPEPTEREELPPVKLLRFPAPEWKKCRSVEDYEKLNDIEEGAYGWVSRAKDTITGKVVALKRLKMENAQDGIPVTGLREIETLMDCEHPNIVALREVVVG